MSTHEKTHYPKLDKTTLVNVVRTVKSFGERNEHSLMTLDAAIKNGLMGTSSSTVFVDVTIADGEYAGLRAFHRRNKWFADHEQYSDGTPVPGI
jgi:hypothetical protein